MRKETFKNYQEITKHMMLENKEYNAHSELSELYNVARNFGRLLVDMNILQKTVNNKYAIIRAFRSSDFNKASKIYDSYIQKRKPYIPIGYSRMKKGLDTFYPEIKELRAKGETMKQIAGKYNCTAAAICSLLQRHENKSKIETKYNKPQPKPKIVTQRDWYNDRPTAILSIPKPQQQSKKFRLFWGLLEFEY